MSPQIRAAILVPLALVVASVMMPDFAGTAGPKDTEPGGTVLYHRDPKHLWNRVYSALFVRIGPDGRTYGVDRLEPLLWAESNNLLVGSAADRAGAIHATIGPEAMAPAHQAIGRRRLPIFFNDRTCFGGAERRAHTGLQTGRWRSTLGRRLVGPRRAAGASRVAGPLGLGCPGGRHSGTAGAGPPLETGIESVVNRVVPLDFVTSPAAAGISLRRL
jgi:hypothetical protein